MKKNNKYTLMQKEYYENATERMSIGNHKEHNTKNYYNILLSDIKNNSDNFKDKIALDFGCGCGRNVKNLLEMADWRRVDGIDISSNNIKYCNEYLKELGYASDKFMFKSSNGIDCKPLKNEVYDFVVSTITLQHICVHEIRYNILKDIFRIMKPGGIFSLQVGYDKKGNHVGYYENYYDAKVTNSRCDFAVEDENYMIKDLERIGFDNITYEITNSHHDRSHNKWIYFRMVK